MSNWFTLATWPLTKGSEVTWKHFEDIRRAIFILYSAQAFAATYEDTWQDNHTYTFDGSTHNGYRKSSIIAHDGMFWVAPSNNFAYGTHNNCAPHKADWKGWYPCADSTKYYHYCKNSLYYLGNMQCGHTGALYGDTEWVCPAADMLPAQTWHLTNCTHFAEWDSSTAYKVGDKVKVSDTTIARDGMICGYICTVANTNQKPTSVFPSATLLTGGSYWRAYGDPVEVAPTKFLSGNSGARYADNRGNGNSGTVNSWPYGISGGWPDQNGSNEYHSDCGYQQYQAAVERVCDGGWMFQTTNDYYWNGNSNEKPKIDFGSHWRWNCNRSCFEYILKRIDKFSWYWDGSYPPANWVYKNAQVGYEDEECEWCIAHGASHPNNNLKSHAVWRRTWRYGMKNFSQLKAQGVISESHNGEYPPASNPTDSNYTQTLLKKTLNRWHGNPYLEALNDMKAALIECSKLRWPVTVNFTQKVGFGSGGTQGDATGEADASLDTADWVTYESDIVGVEGVVTRMIYPPIVLLDYIANTRIIKLTVSITTPPRNAALGGGIAIKSYGLGLSDDFAHDGSYYRNDIYYDSAFTNGNFNLPTFPTKDVNYYEEFNVPLPPDTGGTIEHIFDPPSWPSVPDELPLTCHQHQLEHSATWTKENWVIDISKFYITIDKDISII